jgi:putative peptide zinc metalloprotease protein
MSGSAQPQLNSEIAELIRGAASWDGAVRKREYIISGRTRHFRLSESAYYILQRALAGDTFAQVTGKINAESTAEGITEEQVESAYLRIVAQLALDGDGTDVRPKAFGFWCRTRLFPKNLVMSIARPMAALFRGWAAGLLVAFILAIGIVALKSGGTRMPHEGYFYAYLLFMVSLFLHEFGHAAACYRFGQEPDEIGFTIYLIYPALYSNVTSAWRLERWRRVVVDAGGIFFQSLVGSIYAILYWATGWAAFRVAFLMILVSVVWSLNPLFKFDGYWALSDLMGIANLHKQVWVMFTHWLNRLRSRPAPTLPWPEKVAAVLLAYSVFAGAAWILFSWRVLQAVSLLLARLPQAFTSVVLSFSSGTFPPMNDLRTCLSAILLLPLPGMIVMQAAKHLWKKYSYFISKRWRPNPVKT